MVHSPLLQKRRIPQMSALVLSVDVGGIYGMAGGSVSLTSPSSTPPLFRPLCAVTSDGDCSRRPSNVWTQHLPSCPPPVVPLSDRARGRSILTAGRVSCAAVSSASPDKKRVVFADDRGLALVQVKCMTEPSCVPPRWSDSFVRRLTGSFGSASISAAAVPAVEQLVPDLWRPQFTQPVANYLQLCERLVRQHVAVESVVVRRQCPRLVVVVKVANLHYVKTVQVRVTHDDWRSWRDITAIYQPPVGAPPSPPALYDRFRAELPAPHDQACTQHFCVRFSCQSGEFWDNNDGRNYTMQREFTKAHSAPSHTNSLMNLTSLSCWGAAVHGERHGAAYW